VDKETSIQVQHLLLIYGSGVLVLSTVNLTVHTIPPIGLLNLTRPQATTHLGPFTLARRTLNTFRSHVFTHHHGAWA